MANLPDPPILASVDLRRLPYMPIEVESVANSELAVLATGDEFRAAWLLWCKAWHERPAASLPNDDRLLARYCGVSARKWSLIKECAMRGFVLCSDNRFYHPVIVEKALDAWASSEYQRARANKRWHPKQDAPASKTDAPASAPSDAPAMQEKLREEKLRKENLNPPTPLSRTATRKPATQNQQRSDKYPNTETPNPGTLTPAQQEAADRAYLEAGGDPYNPDNDEAYCNRLVALANRIAKEPPPVPNGKESELMARANRDAIRLRLPRQRKNEPNALFIIRVSAAAALHKGG